MKATASAVIFALVATMAARADEAKAPLDDTKQQLQQLQRDQAAAKTGAGDAGLKAGLPGLQTTLQGREALPASVLDPNQNSNPANRAQTRNDKKAKNWLVDGYDRLDPKAAKEKKGDRNRADAAESGDESKDSETGAQDDLIMAYEKQADSAERKTAASAANAETNRAPLVDPLAPFLQGWLASSPVRDAALASVPKADRTATGEMLPEPPPFASEVVERPVTLGPNDSLGARGANPYLVNVTLPALTDPAATAPVPPLGSNSLLPAGPAPNPTLSEPADSATSPPKSETFKPPPTPADDDKKYFPQLKRF